jgi:hypothetical protein
VAGIGDLITTALEWMPGRCSTRRWAPTMLFTRRYRPGVSERGSFGIMSDLQKSIMLAATSILTLCGCMSDRAAKELGEQIAAPLNSMAQQLSGAHDLAYVTSAFWRMNQRWPKDYPELDTFVQKSDGLLVLGHYDRVEFTPQSEGGLKISFVIQGLTNHTTLPPIAADQKR